MVIVEVIVLVPDLEIDACLVEGEESGSSGLP